MVKVVLVLMALSAALAAPADSGTAGPGTTVKLGQSLQMSAPKGWGAVKPSIGIIAHEFRVPAADGDLADGRATIMSAGGSIEANVERWQKQFLGPDGQPLANPPEPERRTIAGREVTIVDLSGTYLDSRGPMAPAVQRPGYRMLAAVIPTDTANYFVKFYGPATTVAANAEAFQAMIGSVRDPYGSPAR